MGRLDSQRGMRLTLRCGICRRPLGLFYAKKGVSSSAKLVVLDGSVHKTKNETYRIYVKCKCGAKNVFENQSNEITRKGWKKIECIKTP